MTGPWFSPGPPVSSTNKTDRRDIAEILWKVALKHHQTNKLKCVQTENHRFKIFTYYVSCNEKN
jgi:hypothetical protein